MQESNIVRIAIDLRYAQNFQQFWNEEEAQLTEDEPNLESLAQNSETATARTSRLFQNNQMRNRPVPRSNMVLMGS